MAIPSPDNSQQEPPLPPQSTPPRARKRYKILAGIVVLLVIAGFAGFLFWLHSSQFEHTDDATLVGHINPVSTKVTGTIQTVLVNDNQPVKKGQLLATLDPTDYEVALQQAEHNLATVEAQSKTAYNNIAYTQGQAASQVTQAQGTVGTSQSGITESQAAVAEARAAVDSARQAVQQQEANYQKALTDYNRYTGADPEAVSAQQVDVAATNLKVADAARNAARAGLGQAQARLAQAQSGVSTSSSKLTQSRGVYQGAQAQGLQVDVVRGQYESAKAAVNSAMDAVKLAKLNLAYTRIVAPVAGRVGRKTVEVGQRVQPGEPLMSIVGPDVWVVANFKETQLKRMRPGQPVDIKVDAFPNHPFTGRVDSFSPASGAQFALLPPENATGNFTKIVQRIPVKIVLDRKSVDGYEDLLVPGMSTVVSVHVAENRTGRK